MSSNKTNFDKMLESVLKGSDKVDSQLDNLPDEGEEGQSQIEELAPVVYEEKESKLAETHGGSPDLTEDYKFVRSNLYGLIGRSNSALDLALKIAAMSEHPRAIEVAGNLMKISADTSSRLLEIHEKLEKKNPKGIPSDGVTNIQNNYYGSEEKTPKDVDDMLDGLDDN